MLNFYKHYTTTYKNGEKIKTQYCGTFVTENAPENFTEEITWNNLEEKYAERGLCYPFNIWNFKRGRCVSFFNDFGDKFAKDIKEWKEPLNLMVVHEYTLYEPSINYVLNFPCGEKAIKYLVERGMAIVEK